MTGDRPDPDVDHVFSCFAGDVMEWRAGDALQVRAHRDSAATRTILDAMRSFAAPATSPGGARVERGGEIDPARRAAGRLRHPRRTRNRNRSGIIASVRTRVAKKALL